ncbi:hypothetical protein HK100_005961 [Physocladia obscura]|uniref:Major facilitator superfamily (MFS) profile domain-containing protein n=1 Tax=Physocladia obscura TaxID=109957 RepID=A0AAD5T630_9FUNG|nr:hypothetical protein HK100_005961 [Physocladia obscura]
MTTVVGKSFNQQWRELFYGEQWHTDANTGEQVYGVPPAPPRTPLKNPFTLMRQISFQQLIFFLVGWVAWSTDAYDFFCVSLSASTLAKYWGVAASTITQSITYTLLTRSLGAVIFGVLGDLYGRKWPLFINLVLIAVLQLATGFCQSLSLFYGLRALFGVTMGGVWGLSAALALENIPKEPRGLFSGILQQGYALGYLIAAIINLFLVPAVSVGWRSLFYFGSAFSLLVAILVGICPESPLFREYKTAKDADSDTPDVRASSKAFFTELGLMLRSEYLRCIYAVLLMTFFNFMSHGSQDLFPTYLTVTKGFTSHDATVATIIGNLGAICGGTLFGYLSQSYGRRQMIILAAFVGACLIPLWILPSSFGALASGAFFLQFCVQGAWGVIPIYLSELSPPAFRAAFTGVAYQLGNMISSSAAQIEASLGEKFPIIVNGSSVPDYGKVQGILMGIIFALVIIFTLIGRAQPVVEFEKFHRAGVVDESGNLTDVALYAGVNDPVIAEAAFLKVEAGSGSAAKA